MDQTRFLADRDAADQVQYLKMLYTTLSRCNKAIVCCNSEADLFSRICRDMVDLGWAKFAWVGLLDGQNKQLKPVASYGGDVNVGGGSLWIAKVPRNTCLPAWRSTITSRSGIRIFSMTLPLLLGGRRSQTAWHAPLCRCIEMGRSSALSACMPTRLMSLMRPCAVCWLK